MAIDQTDDGKVILSNSTSAVTILLHGATILSWTHKGQELLWLSENAILDGTKAVRGGIPLVFPVFGPAPKGSEFDGLPQHGFARLSEWEFLGQVDDNTIAVPISDTSSDIDAIRSELLSSNINLKVIGIDFDDEVAGLTEPAPKDPVKAANEEKLRQLVSGMPQPGSIFANAQDPSPWRWRNRERGPNVCQNG
ncbi:hypothetical protein DV113_005201 [Geotrichum candidum]|nr:hypothetical protein DV113_005201 [Geotrichum candidum]